MYIHMYVHMYVQCVCMYVPTCMYSMYISNIVELHSSRIHNCAVVPSPADPSPPVNVVAENVTSRTVVVSWDPPVEPNGVILNYTVTFRGIDSPNPVGRDFHQIRTESTVVTSAVLTGLIPGSTYNISVTASTIAGEGEPSEEVSTTTDDEGDLL